ncbi:MAG: hypothetical protein JWQ32_2647 [Marmoricola sp.]|nr:hypothetical protein [Marmoricola sp.]
MRTAPSWTELSWPELSRGAGDLGALFAFRRHGLADASRRRLRASVLVCFALTVSVIVVPAYLRSALPSDRVGHLVAVMPSFYLGFGVLAIMASITSGGGRELIPRDEAVAFPISSVTEHLAALLLAPLNVAWVIQAWAILGATSYVFGPHALAATVVPVLLWIVLATALGQVVGWTFEGLRRGRHGLLVTRSLSAAAFAGVALLVLDDHLTTVLDHSPTVSVYLASLAAQTGHWTRWGISLAVLLALIALAFLAGLVPARWALHRPLRDELRLEGERHEPARNPRSDLAAMLRLDRASIWRSVPLRRGLLVLAMMPGAVALAGNLEWRLITLLPGLVASGAALLFGVNAWCLDGRGALWRDSLPVAPGLAYAAKVIVLFEVLLAAAGLTIVLAAVRAGLPDRAELAAVVGAAVVVSAQVVAACLGWSVRSPYAVDLRSARATPAPPVVMAGYSARLAVVTTVTGLLFSATSLAPGPGPAILLAIPLLCWSGWRLARTAAAWSQPAIRSRVIAVVAS